MHKYKFTYYCEEHGTGGCADGELIVQAYSAADARVIAEQNLDYRFKKFIFPNDRYYNGIRGMVALPDDKG